MRHQGKITSWKDEQGFGFITPNAGGKQVFVHINAFSSRQRRPDLNEIVTYQLNTDAKGRVFADGVGFVDKRVSKRATSGYDNFLLTLAVSFLVFLFVAVLLRILPSFVFGLSLVLSMVTFGVYAKDKSAARKGEWRTEEKTLHLFALFGGWPGALVAQKFLRHKSKKLSFQINFWLTVVLNGAALVWLSTSSGNAFFRSVASVF
jgi:uncharacterized membrane protein YsdA (DUF1294 family)/cold shock CspA family protein